MAKTKITEIDVRKQGPLSYKELQNVNNADFTNEDELQALEEYRKSLYSRKSTYSPYEHMDLYVVSPIGRTKNSWGESRLDNNTASEEEFSRLNDVRAENQGFFSEVGNGLAKGAILAGTTFLDGTVGLLVGLGTAIAENKFSGIYDNPVSKALKSVNDWAEEALPNYYSEAELAGPWYNNIFSGNFLGDKFIKNLGFTVGAFYSGGLYAKGAQALVKGAASLAKNTGASIKAVKGILNSGSTTAALVGSGISALNEGRIEALNNSEDWFNYNKLLYADDYINTLNALGLDYGVDENGDIILKGPINPRALQFQDNYNLTLAKLAEDRAKMGNHDLLFNIPILMASNVFLFGKLYAGGYKTARRATNIVKRAGGYETAKTTTKGVLKSMAVPLSEGMEEISQKAASEVSGNYYSTDVNNFYKAKMDPNAEQQTLSWINSAAEGIAKTVSEGSSWEEFFIGYLTGALGMPGFRSFKNSENKFQSPVYLLGGAYGTFKEYSELMRRELELAEYLNKRVQDPKFVNYYQGLIRHNKFQNDMNMAAEEGNAFEYKNAEHNQLLSDIIMFDNAGKLQDLNDMIVEAFNTSDENLDDIINNTTSTTKNPDGSEVKVGPYIDKSGNPATGTEKSKQEMIESITKRKDEMLSLIEDYRKVKEEIDIDYNEVFSNELLEELAWLKLQGQNWRERATELAKEIKPTITKLRNALYNEWRTTSMQKTEEDKHGIAPGKNYKDLDLYERKLNSYILTLLQLEALEDLYLAVFLTADENLSKDIQQVLENLQKRGDNPIEDSEYTDFVSKTSDIKKSVLGYNKFNLKLKEYREDPLKIKEQQELVKEETAKQDLEQKTSDLKLKLLSSKNVFDFRSILEQEEDEEIKNSTLESLQKENNIIAKHYKDLQQYKSAVYKALNDSKKDAKTIENAIKLFENHFNNSSNLQEIGNFNSVHINDPQHILDNTKTDEENLRDFTEALWTLMQAMNKVNNDNAFKDSFSKEYKELKQQGVPVTNTPSKDTTGDSGTATIPPVNGPTAAPVELGPVGVTSKQLIIDENKEFNNTTQNQSLVDDLHKGLKPYYRPAIPELHINAVKNGDFRPFNVVVLEKENRNFDIIYNYLKDSGAFSYVNEGNLKEGDSLYFMIDPQFEESVKDQPWHKEPTVFIVHKTKEGNYQIVGSLDESEYSVKKYTGLSELLNKIRTEYKQKNNTLNNIQEQFIASPKTKVSQIMVGKIPYTNEEKNLQQIPNVSKNGNQPIFGIMKNGSLTTNNKLKDDEILGLTNISDKEGRLYLLIPNAAGKYSPVAVRVKHFNETEFDLNDIAVANTPIGKSISEAIIALAESLSQEDVSDAVQALEQDIYFRDVIITWFKANAGDGIVISKKIRKPDGSYEKIMISGKEYIKEEKHTVYFTNKKSVEIGGLVYDASALEKLGQTDITGEPKDPAVILKEILRVITKFNLPLQVSTGKINNGNYNKIILNSNILTSNISNAEVLGSWFTTDYFDSEGNLKKADTIKAPILNTGNSPVGGKESYKGIPITIGADTVYVDLSKNMITDNSGNSRPITPNDILLQELAWAQNAYGNYQYSERMIDGKIITPTNRVLDRKTLKYLSDEEAQIVINKINSVNSARKNSEIIISKIYENLNNVDKTATDSEYYYIKEEDGQYHPYARVHTKIGSNSQESDKQLKDLKDIQLKLSTYANNINQYNSYLDSLSNYHKVNLNEYKGKTGITDRKTIVERIKNSMLNLNSRDALLAGSAVDTVVRLFFTDKALLKLPENMTYEAYSSLLTSLEGIQSDIEAGGEKFLTNNIVLYNKYPNEERIAGEVDILAVDKNGNFKIYDVKTGKYSFHDFTSNGLTFNYFKNKATWQNMSNEVYYTKLLSVYKELFEYQYNTPIVALAILPFVLQKNLGVVNNITKEKGILVNYTPVLSTPKTTTTVTSTNVQKTEQTSDNLPIFNSTLEISNPLNRVLPEFNMKNSKVGYYKVGNTIYKGYLYYIGTVDNVPIHLAKITTTQHNNDEDNTKNYEFYEYLVVFPNGNTFSLFKNTTKNEELVAKEALEALNNNITRVHEESSKNGLPVTAPTVEEKPITGGARAMVAIELSINNNDDEFEDDLDLPSYRELDSNNYNVFDKQKELQWLNKVLPQLSELDRVKFVEGLIQVNNSGAAAWGKFEQGIITLSNIAAEGTVYHEAFHVVFNLMLNESEREDLLELAKKMYGDKSVRDLEEDLAEGFREYVMTREEKGILNKIKNFFKSLYIKIKYWSAFKPHIYSYYKNINNGKYSKRALSENIVKALYGQEQYTQEMQEIKDKAIADRKVSYSFNTLPQEIQQTLIKKGWSQELFDSISEKEKEIAVTCAGL